MQLSQRLCVTRGDAMLGSPFLRRRLGMETSQTIGGGPADAGRRPARPFRRPILGAAAILLLALAAPAPRSATAAESSDSTQAASAHRLTVDEAVQMALAHNFDLKVSEQNVE